MTRRHRHTDRGQATVELALAMPVLCVLLLGIVQIAVVVRDQLAIQLAAREAARAASISVDPGAAPAAAARAVRLAPLRVSVDDLRATVTVTVRYTDHTDVALIGALLPDVELSATVTMAKEPP